MAQKGDKKHINGESLHNKASTFEDTDAITLKFGVSKSLMFTFILRVHLFDQKYMFLICYSVIIGA